MYTRAPARRYTRSAYARSRTTTRRRTTRSSPRFATVGFARNVEKKYFDKTYQANNNRTTTGDVASSSVLKDTGVTFISNQWGTYAFGSTSASTVISNDMLKGLATGTTARTRIGNKIKPRYLKGAFTFTACTLNNAGGDVGQGGEQWAQAGTVSEVYMRTTYRFMIVKDLQVNSTDNEVTWQQVMDTTGLQAGVHSELNVDNMGRFMVILDRTFTVDADDPQKTINFNLAGSRIGPVRYNGPTGTALTDKGVYVVYAAFVMGFQGAQSEVTLPSPVGHSRLCFVDD